MAACDGSPPTYTFCSWYPVSGLNLHWTCRSGAGDQQESAVLPSLCCAEGKQPSDGTIHIFTQAPAGSLQASEQVSLHLSAT